MGKKSANSLIINCRIKRSKVLVLFLSTFLVFIFQNCTQSPTSFIRLNNEEEKTSTTDSSGGGIGGNGGGIEGKPISTYFRLTPNKYCEQNDPIFAQLNVFTTHAELIQKDVIDCKPKLTQIDLKDLRQSPLQNEVISYKDGVFWSKDEYQKKSNLIDGNYNFSTVDLSKLTFVEVWCQTTSIQNPNDYIIYNSAETFSYKSWQPPSIANLNGSPSLIQSLNLNRQIYPNFIKYFNSDIELEIASSKLVRDQQGTFKGVLKNNKEHIENKQLICKMSGALDSIAWPTPLKLVNHIKQLTFLKSYPGIIALSDQNLVSNTNLNLANNQNKIDELFYFDWTQNKMTSIYQANKSSSYKQTISNFQLSPFENQIIFRSNMNAENTYELFSITFPGLTNLQHVGNSLINNIGLKLNTFSDFAFSSNGTKLLFKDDSHRLIESEELQAQRLQFEESFNFTNALPFLQSYDLTSNKVDALHGDILDPIKGTAVKDYYELNSTTLLARIGPANFTLNVNGSNKFYIIDYLNLKMQELPIDLTPFKTSNLKSSGAVWIPDFNFNAIIDPVLNSKVLVNKDASGFLFLAGSWDLKIHWFYFDITNNLLHPAPINFIPLQYITNSKVIGLCNQNKDLWIGNKMNNSANCYWDFSNGKIYNFKQSIHLTNLNANTSDKFEFIISDTENHISQICIHDIINQSNICHIQMNIGFYHLEKIQYMQGSSKILILADTNNDNLNELYLYEPNREQPILLSDQFNDYGSVIDFVDSNDLSEGTQLEILPKKQRRILFYSKNYNSLQYYFFEYLDK